ncbi:hypothetical protein BJ878DRAFT_93166 [Calycina marina]|uniref:Alpha/beta hydrolase fold-3 domain-containing protein n=1 Tax=Calycina marina TaxID=1763456 RepID=A0A9P7Z9Z5_9HELO|nr:hypothetical protein BJ878DRAFT_93166 [Calycina marina]
MSGAECRLSSFAGMSAYGAVDADELGIDKNQVSIGGPSAGGNVAAVCALMTRDQPEIQKLALQLLVLPVVDEFSPYLSLEPIGMCVRPNLNSS